MVAFGFGAGLAPRAPGTAGTLVAIPLWWLLHGLDVGIYLLVCLAFFLLGCWVAGRTGRDLGVHDHGGIVWDEVVGYLVTMTAAPVGIGWVVGGLVLFRILDIIKPWPISWVDARMHGGCGVMADDVLAGLGSLALLQAAAAWLP